MCTGLLRKMLLKEDRNNSLTSFYSSVPVSLTLFFFSLQGMPLIFCCVFYEHTLSRYACILSIKSHRFAGSVAIPFHGDISQWRM